MLYLAGVDCGSAPIEVREGLALDDGQIKEKMQAASASGAEGCMLLCTCNRTELYISAPEGFDIRTLFAQLFDTEEKYCFFYEDEAVLRHIFETACGLNSLIKRETQIITQLTGAEHFARENGGLDPELEVMLRLAVTTGKKAVSVFTEDIRLTSAHLAVDRLEREYGSLKDKSCLVIGNGRVGRLAAELLLKRGARVTITLRKKTGTIVPRGCSVIKYDERYNTKADILVSATKSPHYTITADRLKFRPDYVVDLAVPRDTAPEIREEYGDHFCCIDDLKTTAEDYTEIYSLIDESIDEYYIWKNYRDSVPAIQSIKELLVKRLCASGGYSEEEISEVVFKTADMLFGGMREAVTPELTQKCLDKISARARL